MSSAAGWLGRLRLTLENRPQGTQLASSSHEGPLRIQRVLYPEGPGCPHIYLLHPPGGVVGGDRLETQVELGPDAQLLLTTPAAQKLYRSAGAESEISNWLSASSGATLEWLPSETLAFSSARALCKTRVQLAAGAAFIGWEIACYGMPARGERFESGRVVSRFELFRDETPLLIESFELGASPEVLVGAFALRGQPVVANLYAVPAGGSISDQLVESVRDAISTGAGIPAAGEPAQGLCSVSSLNDLLVVRALGPNVEGVRASLIRAWQVLRPALLHRSAVLPRVWST